MEAPTDMIGRRFGKYTVIKFDSFVFIGKKKSRIQRWLCRCDCGTERVAYRGNLLKKNGNKACSKCANIGKSPQNKTHGMSKSREFSIWLVMKKRCYNKKFKYYFNYGGRGISVCSRWIDSFQNFLADMGECPEGMTLERKNVDGDYEPLNCKWATRKEQGRNTRSNRLLTLKGETLCVSEWSERTGLEAATIKARIDVYGYSIEDALTKPLQNDRRG